MYSGSEYTLEYYTLYDSSSNNTDDSLSTYLTSTLRSGSGIVNYYLTQSLEYLTGSNQFRNSVKRSVNFIPSITDDWTLNFKSTTSTANAYWQVGSVSLKTSNELGYSPDSFNFIIPIDRQLEQETFDFKFEYFDINQETLDKYNEKGWGVVNKVGDKVRIKKLIPVIQVGSTIQQNFGENITKHGYGVYDVETDQYDFVNLPNPKPFLKFQIKSIDDLVNGAEKLLNG